MRKLALDRLEQFAAARLRRVNDGILLVNLEVFQCGREADAEEEQGTCCLWEWCHYLLHAPQEDNPFEKPVCASSKKLVFIALEQYEAKIKEPVRFSAAGMGAIYSIITTDVVISREEQQHSQVFTRCDVCIMCSLVFFYENFKFRCLKRCLFRTLTPQSILLLINKN